MSKADKPASLEGVSSAERTLTVLTAFRSGDSSLSLADLAERTGLVKSTIMRLAISLEQFGLLVRLPDGSYRLDAECLRLGSAYQQSFKLVDHVVPALERLMMEIGETASFYVRHGDKRLCLFRVESQHAIRMHVQPGESRPMDKAAIAEVLRRFEAGLQTPALDADLPLYTAGVTDPHTASLAMPVFGMGDKLVGALAVSGPVSRLTAAFAASKRAPMRRAGLALSRSCGAALSPER